MTIERPVGSNAEHRRSLSTANARTAACNLPLEGLSADAFALLRTHLREHEFREGTMLWDGGGPVAQVFFPVSGMITVRVPTKEGHGTEVAIIGREGNTGLQDGSVQLPALTQGVVQVPGRFLSISGLAFASAVRQDDEIDQMAAVCNGWLLLQAQQIAACNAVHPADARFCRWLLRASDALAADMIPVTQETVAHALGIRRTTATLIAQQLQQRGIISYSRGKIMIRDHADLKTAACDCYRALGRPSWSLELLGGGGASVQDRHSAAG